MLDVNDNPPVYQDQPYSFSVAESASPGATLFSLIKVSDADEGENAKVTLECVREEVSVYLTDAPCIFFGIDQRSVCTWFLIFPPQKRSIPID